MKRPNRLSRHYEEGMARIFKATVMREPTKEELRTLIEFNDEAAEDAYMEELKEKDKEAFIALNTPQWKKEGQFFRRRREELKLKIAYCSRQIGIAPETLKKFESGRYVRNRKLIVSAYHHLLELELARIRELCYTDIIRKLKKKVS